MYSKMETLRSALLDKRPPFIAGACALPEGDLTLYYGTPGKSERIDLTKTAAEADLKRLSDACGAATFGVNQQDVLDESYRKARKMDVTNFSSKFDLHKSGILNLVHSELLQGHDENKQIEAELYKLNIYDEGSFFKTHKDTPRGERMFGSLVIVFPTVHEGGSLILRHRGEEWNFDSAKEVVEQPKPSIGYIAFYSDVEHEVTMVTSGYRVTLTYNLYFASKKDPKPYLVASPMEIAFTSALRALLDDPDFLPQGGNIGFALHHQYPTKDSLEPLVGNLKGVDAVVDKVCEKLSLKADLQAAYTGYAYDSDEDEVLQLVLSGGVPDLRYLYESTPLSAIKEQGGKVAVRGGDGPARSGEIEIWWIKDVKPEKARRLESVYMAYGNEASLEYLYGDCCLVILVGPAGDRSTL